MSFLSFYFLPSCTLHTKAADLQQGVLLNVCNTPCVSGSRAAEGNKKEFPCLSKTFHYLNKLVLDAGRSTHLPLPEAEPSVYSGWTWGGGGTAIFHCQRQSHLGTGGGGGTAIFHCQRQRHQGTGAGGGGGTAIFYCQRQSHRV